jgi:hypothetical protein
MAPKIKKTSEITPDPAAQSERQSFIMTVRKKTANLLPYFLFFALVFVYFAFFGSYAFFFQEKSSLFIFSLDFLLENLKQPGGFIVWLGIFLSTFYYIPVAGAFILSFILTMIVLLASKIISFYTGRQARLVPFLIGFILFYLNSDYHFLLFNNLGLLISLILFHFIQMNNSVIRGWLPTLLVPFIYFLTGGFAWIFLLLISFDLIFYRKNSSLIRFIAIWSISLIMLLISKELLFFQTLKTLIIFPFSYNLKGLQQILNISAALLISILPLLSKFKIREPEKLRISDFSLSLITCLLLIVLTGIIGLKRYDSKAKQYFFVEELFDEGKYEEVIAYNTENPPKNSLTIFLNNIALSETEQLDDNLFRYPQSPDGRTLFLKWDLADEILKRGAYFYYTLGMINEAHRWAFENMVMKGLTPEDLKMIIRTDLINGNYKVASAYISKLKKTLFYRQDAKKYEKLAGSDEAFNADKELARKRATKVQYDFFTITDNPQVNLELILANDSLNRKAFEYEIAFMMLNKNLSGIASELPRFESYGFKRLPRHIEEAVLALTVSNKGNMPDIGHLEISTDTEQKWAQYLDVLKLYRSNVKAAEPALKRQYGDTFWYYVFYK